MKESERKREKKMYTLSLKAALDLYLFEDTYKILYVQHLQPFQLPYIYIVQLKSLKIPPTRLYSLYRH